MSSSGGNSSETARHYPNRGSHHSGAGPNKKPQPSKVWRKAENAWRDWREYKSKTGRSYYFNVITKDNCWEKPAGWDPGGGSRPQPNGRHPNRNLVNAIKQAVEQLPREKSEPSVTIPSTNNLRPPKKRHLPPQVNPPLTGPNNPDNRLNGDQQPGVFKPARLTRAEEFKRVIDEIPKLPECPDFEALRPLKDNNLISEDVRKLTNGKKRTFAAELTLLFRAK